MCPDVISWIRKCCEANLRTRCFGGCARAHVSGPTRTTRDRAAPEFRPNGQERSPGAPNFHPNEQVRSSGAPNWRSMHRMMTKKIAMAAVLAGLLTAVGAQAQTKLGPAAPVTYDNKYEVCLLYTSD